MASAELRELVIELKQQLGQPLRDYDQLVGLLRPPLLWLDLVDGSAATPWSSLAATDIPHFIRRHLPALQLIIVQEVAQHWTDPLEAAGQRALFDAYFSPSPSAKYSSAVARSAYSVLLAAISPKSSAFPAKPLSPESLRIALRLLARLSQDLPLSSLYRTTFGQGGKAAMMEWEEALRDVVALPSKASNAAGEAQNILPIELQQSCYIAAQARNFEALLASMTAEVEPLASVLGKFARQGYFSAYLGGDHPTFWSRLYPLVLHRLSLNSPTSSSTAYSSLWRQTIRSLPPAELSTVMHALLLYLNQTRPTIGSDEITANRTRVKTEAAFLFAVVGPLTAEQESDVWEVVVKRCLLQRQGWSAHLARVVVCWASALSSEALRESSSVSSLDALLRAILSVWGAEQMVQQESEDRHLFLTVLIASSLAHLRPGCEVIKRLSMDSVLIHAVQAHLSALRPAIRLRGMLVAELFSARSGVEKPLSFGEECWKGKGDGREACMALRTLAEAGPEASEQGWAFVEGDLPIQQPVASTSKVKLEAKSAAKSGKLRSEQKPKIEIISSSTPSTAFDDEEDLQPYEMPASPTESLSDLDDPSVYTPAKKKPRPPVYIADLAAYLRSSEDADKVELGLQHAAALIRKKAGWGGELSENAVDLAYALLGLQDSFETEDFDDLRLAALTSLVFGCPQLAAPCVSIAFYLQFFSTNYSIQQRYSMLSALALGARELAGLPSLVVSSAYSKALPPSSTATFPSKALPPKLHRQLAPPDSPIDRLTASITNTALSDTKAEAEETIPEAARHKLLTVRRSAALTRSGSIIPSKNDEYGSMAVDLFLMPLINRFWLYLRDLATAPRDASSVGPMVGGTASAILLEPLVLTKYLGTLAVLLDAARLSPSFLAVLTPEALELLLALRSAANDAAVGAAALEVALVVLDGSVRLDHGRTMAHRLAPLLGQIQAWAMEAWRGEEGSSEVGKVGRAAAGVLLRIDSIYERFRSAALVA